MIHAARRFGNEAEDFLRYNPAVRGVIGRYKLWRVDAPDRTDQQAIARSIHQLCAAARLIDRPEVQDRIVLRIKEHVALLDPVQVKWKEFVPGIDSHQLPYAAILKPWIGGGERGVIFLAFEFNWIRLLAHCDLQELAKRYTLVVAPSSSPFNIVNFILPSTFPMPVLSLINHEEDIEILPKISTNFRVVRLYTSHWVDPSMYCPRARTERDIDIVMIAMFGKVKRHHLLFKALRSMPRTIRVLLIGQDQDGRTAETMRSEARDYGVDDRLTIMSNLSHQEVIQALCRSKVSVLFSLREGSSVVVAESLFADTPTALLKSAYNGSRAFINESTGRFLRERDLAGQLLDFLSSSNEYSPRRWSEANISCHRSTAALNETLKERMRDLGQQWTQDIATLCWRPYPRLVNEKEAAWLRSERDQIRQQFGVEIGPEPSSSR
jgi:glycosyltransferase involved in cell wall biosynthesis